MNATEILARVAYYTYLWFSVFVAAAAFMMVVRLAATMDTETWKHSPQSLVWLLLGVTATVVAITLARR